MLVYAAGTFPFGFSNLEVKFVEIKIPICEKYVLSVEEAALYFHIGVNRLRKLISQHKTADWVLWNQTHAQIKRKKFEQFIDSLNTL